MEHEKLIKNFNEIVFSLNMRYNIFYSNFQYRKEHFKTEEEYFNIQKNLAEEIKANELELKMVLQKFISSYFPNVKIIAYDSRGLCIIEKKEFLGVILLDHVTNEEVDKILSEIKSTFNFNIKIDIFENLPEECKNKFTNKN